MLIRISVVVLVGGCHLYFDDAPHGEPEPEPEPAASVEFARPCIRTIASGDVLPDGADELFITHACEGGPIIENVNYWSDTLHGLDAQADFQVRFRRTVVADLDGIAPDDVLAVWDGAPSLWAFTRRGYSGRGGQTIGFARPFDDIATGDLNGDGQPDLIVAGDNAIRAVLSEYPASLPYSVSTSDETIMLEGRPFLAVTPANLGGPHGRDLFFVAKRADGSLELGTAVQTTVEPPAFGVQTVPEPAGTLLPLVVADVDGDGIRDVIGAASRVFVRGSKHGEIAYLDEAVSGLAVGDLDGDGIAEPILLTHDGTAVRRVRVNAIGAHLVLTGEPLLDEGGDAIVVADLDGDQRDDVVLARDLAMPTSRLVLRQAASF